ncbi:amidase [Sphingosinicella rhizophila]|uniref:Amidase n=1 Tax=Sphingosinicella rhizophila TaxID=3050082 RepID=A0ABU3Q505_9SPHN|nr:amidase [Sphingosinicella sp. GR2756]MDT9598492.1 amidase [Sphingosinicella sp. GR2756]
MTGYAAALAGGQTGDGQPAMMETIFEQSRALGSGRISSVELARRSLARAEAAEALNVIISLDSDPALDAARAADDRAAHGERRGWLDGIPLAHKDMFDRDGRRASFGSRLGQQEPATATATVLRRLDQAGSLCVARLNMVEYALGVTGHNATFGHCRNLRDPARITGGSSSGSAAAVAAGIVAGSLGSDTGGSIRIPASCCGLVGLKPSYGRVSRHGAMPLSVSLDCISPIARTVDDCALLLAAIAGPDPADPSAVSAAVSPADAPIDAERRPKLLYPGFTIAKEADEDVASSIDALVQSAAASGATIVETHLPDLTGFHHLAETIQRAESAAFHAPRLADHRATYTPHVLRRIEAGFEIRAVDYLAALGGRADHRSAFVDRVFGDADALIVPTLNMAVPTIAETDEEAIGALPELVNRMTRWTRWISYLGLPALSLPCGTDRNGMPIGVQIVGRYLAEDRLLRIARGLEQLC